MKKIHFRKILAIGLIILFFGVSFGASVEPLSCDAYGPYEGNIMEDIEFDGTATGGSPPYEFFWDFGEGNTSNGDPHPTHNYANAGNYTVILTVTDSENDTASDTTWVLINSPPTPPEITCPENVKIGKPFPVEAVSTDPEGDECYYRDEFNGCTGPWFGPYPSGQVYKYSILITGSPGTYSLGLQSKDTHDAESEWVYVQINATKNKAINTPFLTFLQSFLQSHPNIFLMLQLLIQRLGL